VRPGAAICIGAAFRRTGHFRTPRWGAQGATCVLRRETHDTLGVLQLRLTTAGEPVRVSIWHYPECQGRTGSVFGTQARFPREHR